MLKIDERRGPLIRFAFEQYATGLYSVDKVRSMLLDKGLEIAKQTLINAFEQPVYTGKIVLKAWKDEEEELIQGLHEALVTEEIFYACGDIPAGKKKQLSKLSVRVDNLPLRGHLNCSKCGRRLTGSNSTSR